MTVPARKEPPGPHDPDRTVMTALIEAALSYRPKARELARDWAPNVPPSYVEVGVFGRHLVEQLLQDSTQEFDAIFDVIERLLLQGDLGERYLVTWGLIEGIQNIAANREDSYLTVRRFRPWLRPATSQAWDEVHALWGTRSLDPSRDIKLADRAGRSLSGVPAAPLEQGRGGDQPDCDHEDHRPDDVDLDRDADARRSVDVHREGDGPAGGEVGDHEVVD